MIPETLLKIQVTVLKGQACPSVKGTLPSGSEPQELLRPSLKTH